MLIGLIVAGSLAAGSCAGALAGQYTVTGGFHPAAGWQVPGRGSDAELAAMPPAAATERVSPAAQFVGYYPDRAPDLPTPDLTPQFSDAAARDFDALYDAPADDEPRPAPVASPADAAGDADQLPPAGDDGATAG